MTMTKAWGIEVRTLEEVERGLIREDIRDVAYQPRDPRRYSEDGRLKMGIANYKEIVIPCRGCYRSMRIGFEDGVRIQPLSFICVCGTTTPYSGNLNAAEDGK